MSIGVEDQKSLTSSLQSRETEARRRKSRGHSITSRPGLDTQISWDSLPFSSVH